MERITNKHLDYQLEILNRYYGIENANSDPVGSFYVAAYNGGFWLERIVNESGGCTDISKRGTKREIYEQLLVLNKGLRLFADEKENTVLYEERVARRYAERQYAAEMLKKGYA